MGRGIQDVMTLWGGFIALILLILALDLGVFNRQPKAPTILQALSFAGATTVLALLFAAFLHQAYADHWAGLGMALDAVDHRVNDGRLAALKFLTGYVVELSLSMDNVFVIALIFAHLRVPLAQQHRVLFWGVLGALVDEGCDDRRRRGARRALPLGTSRDGRVPRHHGRPYAGTERHGGDAGRVVARTLPEQEVPCHEGVPRRPLSHHAGRQDLDHAASGRARAGREHRPVFAVDSIPAIFGITADAFLVFTSNVFAILCLRSLYFGLAHLLAKFRYLETSLALILGLVGVKMLSADWTERLFGDSVNFWMLGTVGSDSRGRRGG